MGGGVGLFSCNPAKYGAKGYLQGCTQGRLSDVTGIFGDNTHQADSTPIAHPLHDLHFRSCRFFYKIMQVFYELTHSEKFIPSDDKITDEMVLVNWDYMADFKKIAKILGGSPDPLLRSTGKNRPALVKFVGVKQALGIVMPIRE